MTDTGWLCLYCLVEDQTEAPAVSMLLGTAVCIAHAHDVAERHEQGPSEPMVLQFRVPDSED